MTLTYDSNIYRHHQIWRLIRDLTACGWCVSIVAFAESRPFGTKTGKNAYRCDVFSSQWECMTAMRFGDTPWAAIVKAVETVVIPTESGEK